MNIVDLNNKKTNRLIYLGTDYGGWAIDERLIKNNSIIYSFGVGTDISFDMELITRYGCSIFAFDPTPRCIKWIESQELQK